MTQRINGELKLIWKLFVFGLLGDNDLQPDWTGILQRLQVRRTILQAESLTVWNLNIEIMYSWREVAKVKGKHLRKPWSFGSNVSCKGIGHTNK